MKYKFLNTLGILILFTIVFVPSKIFAATINISSGSLVNKGDTSVIDIYLNTEGQNINSLDGSISLSDDHGGNFEVKDLSLSNSVFTMWPRKPSLEDGQKISFVGGVPGGINGDRMLLFKVIVKINQAGDFKITPKNLTAYLNDGLGTSIKIAENSSTILISKAQDNPKNK